MQTCMDEAVDGHGRCFDKGTGCGHFVFLSVSASSDLTAPFLLTARYRLKGTGQLSSGLYVRVST
jgi:hypothetical protein